MRKIFTYSNLLTLFLIIILLMGFGAIVKYHYDGGKKFKFFQKTAIIISSVPMNLRVMFKNKGPYLDKPPLLFKHKNKKKFKQFIENKRDALLILPRYDHSTSRSVVEVIDLNNFEILHSYQIKNIDKMLNQVSNVKEFPAIKIDNAPHRFKYLHPLLLSDGSIISDSSYSVEFKLDFCSNLKWINDEEVFHHSKMLDHDGNILIPAKLSPPSKHVKKYSLNNYHDDAIIKINSDGKILYKKSVTEILIENKIIQNNFALNSELTKNYEPIHLNDIEPVLSDSVYWKKGDVFLSLRHQSSIIHYRPRTNEVINYITGPFSQQHDVDIISDKEISIFNNNNFFFDTARVTNEYYHHSEILIYNFETNGFRKLFNNQLKSENFKTETQGLSHMFKDGSLMIEETDHGRIILFNNQGKKEWELVNKDKNENIGFLSWFRVIEDRDFIENFKSMINTKKC